MSAKTNACRILDASRIAYTLHEYEWDENQLDAYTVAGKVGLQPGQLYKTLVLRGDKTGILMACIPGDQDLNLKALAQASGNKKVEMAQVKEIQSLTGYVRGGVSPIGTKRKYPLYIHESIVDMNLVSISAGRRGLQIFMDGKDLVSVSEAVLTGLVL